MRTNEETATTELNQAVYDFTLLLWILWLSLILVGKKAV